MYLYCKSEEGDDAQLFLGGLTETYGGVLHSLEEKKIYSVFLN